MHKDLAKTIIVWVSIVSISVDKSEAQNTVQFTNKNVIMGSKAGINNTTGSDNVFVGASAGLTNTSGIANVFVGSQAGLANTTGLGNMFLGQLAGSGNTTGNYNMFIGNSSGQATTTGSGNTAIGDGSGLRNTTGAQNTNIGQYAGVDNITGSNNVFVGFNSGVPSGTGNLSNAIAIGALARVTQSNSLILGSGTNVGIGNSAPSARLHITTGTAGSSGLRLENLTSATTASVTSQTKFLTVDANGNVILGSTTSSGRLAVTDALWEQKGSFLQSSQDNGVIIGNGVSKTPGDYNLFVSKGILTEKIKVAVKNTTDWSDKVFAPSYSLRRLSEVETYINANQHLPGVPSAAEVVEKGVDVAKMDAKLLEKIEELTLYSIQQQKEIDELKQMVKQLLEKEKK